MTQHLKASDLAKAELPWMQLRGGASYTFERSLPVTARLDGIVTIEHVADALAKINRYTGNSVHPMNVAHHSVLVSRLVHGQALTRLYALAHDAHEMIIGDIGQPLKLELRRRGCGQVLEDLEAEADEAVFRIFGLAFPMPDDIYRRVKQADMEALAVERRDFMDRSLRPWGRLPDVSHVPKLEPKGWATSKVEFVTEFRRLKHILEA